MTGLAIEPEPIAPDPRAPVLAVEDLEVTFATEDGPLGAVRSVSYELGAREVLGIVGESGSGKSVSALAVMGLLPRTATVKGSIRYRGEELVGMTPRQLNRYRGSKVAMIFQDPMTSLNPVHRIGDQIAEVVVAHQAHPDKHSAWARAIEMLEKVGIPNPAARARMFPHEFSGGMRQRVMIAMALANDPDVVLADEPTTALDVTVQAQILELLVALKDEFDAAIVLITHDLGVVAGMADRVMVMYAGRPVELAMTEPLFAEPHMPYTLGLLGALPRLDSDGIERLVPITGSPPSLLRMAPGCPFQPRCPLATGLCDEVEPVLRAVGLDPHHLTACHHAEQLLGAVAPGDVFSADVYDDVLVADLGAVAPDDGEAASGDEVPRDGEASAGEGPRDEASAGEGPCGGDAPRDEAIAGEATDVEPDSGRDR